MAFSEQKPSTELIFFVNGEKVVDAHVDPEWTLLYYLREKLQLKGTKLGCGEGGCGACTVMISKFNLRLHTVRHFSTYACLTPLVSLHGKSVTTVEGLGSTRTKLHPVQERITLAHGSQCGFCTPGFVMSMYSLLRNSPTPSMKKIEENLMGNLCRCTGYRPILEGFSTFSSESFKGCGKKDCCQLNGSSKSCGEEKQNTCLFDFNKCSTYNPSQDTIFPPWLKVNAQLFEQEITFQGPNLTWYQPVDLDSLLKLKSEYPQAVINVGNTELAIEAKFKNKFRKVHLNPSRVPELNNIQVYEDGILVGAAVTLTEIEENLEFFITQMPETRTRIFASLLEMLRWFGSKQIKNVASLGGNLMKCSPVSDLSPILFAAGAKATLKSQVSSRTVIIDDSFFTGYCENLSKPEEVLVNIFIPFSYPNEYFRSFKQSKRKTDDIATVNCALKVHISWPERIVNSVRFVFGGMDARIKQAKEIEKVLCGKIWSTELFESGIESLVSEFQLDASAPGGMVKYRESLVLSFFFKFYVFVNQEIQKHGEEKEELLPMSSANCIHERPKSCGTQNFEEVAGRGPVGKPLVHSSGFHHASGEATFTDDIPSFEKELHAVPIISTKAFADIINIDYDKALKIEGVHSFISSQDISEERNKLGIVEQDEELFASKEVRYVGNVIGVIVADSKATARKASKTLKVEYKVKEPIITIEDAIEKKSFWEPLMIEDGNVDEGFNSADHILEGEIRIGGQEHFYLEPQSTLAVPTNDGEMHIFSATQNPSEAQKNVANALGLPLNRVVCKAKRLGGGFGGKEIKSGYVATYAALAAHKLGRPIRITLDRDDDMMITGGRHPFLAKWKVGFFNDGRLETLEVEMFANAGFSLDVSYAMATKSILHIDNVYRVLNTRIKCTCCRTNLASNTACRGTGAPQSMLIMEDILTRIASFLKMGQYEIRNLNMFKTLNPRTHYGQVLEHCTVRQCWDQVLLESDYHSRIQKVQEFNVQNQFYKRGISVIPSKMAVSFGLQTLEQAAALVHIYKDGSVLLNHAGVEMGQGLHTKMIQIASRVLEIPVDDIYISETATDKIPNTSPSAASCSSDLNGMAVKQACEILKERLCPYLSQGCSWSDSIEKAYNDRVSLSATGFFATPGLLDIDLSKRQYDCNPYNYFTYGAAVTEVEIDILTGDHTVLRTDIVMDVGQSLNPAIDIGQIEGAFLFGYGLYVLEEHIYSPEGQMRTIGPSNYKIPGIHNIPCEFNVSLLRGSTNPRAVYSSRGIGEPPLFLSSSVFFAIKEAIKSTRKDGEPFRLDSPATSERIRLACQDLILKKISDKPRQEHVTPWSITA